MTDDLRKRLRAKIDVGSSLLDGLPVNPDGAEAADRIEALTAENERLREALTDIGVYGCGMLNQPAALNGPEEEWLKRRIWQMESVARAALGDTQ